MSYCCTVDVVTRQLPVPASVRFPHERKRLLRLMADDQQERASAAFFSTDRKVAEAITHREIARIEEVLAIVGRIKTPSVRNVGLDGSRAIWLIALHNFTYKNSGRTVLKKMRHLFYRDKTQVFYPGIPYLTDRIMVGSVQPVDPENLPHQLYGTQGLSMKLPDGTVRSEPFPITNMSKLVERRKKFDLEPITPCTHHP